MTDKRLTKKRQEIIGQEAARAVFPEVEGLLLKRLGGRQEQAITATMMIAATSRLADLLKFRASDDAAVEATKAADAKG